MEAFFLTCVVVAFFVTKGRTDTAAYSNGKEPPGLARARMRHEAGGGARTASGRPTGRGAFGLLVASRWAEACRAAQHRGEHRAARRRAWFDETAPGGMSGGVRSSSGVWSGRIGRGPAGRRPAACTQPPAPAAPAVAVRSAVWLGLRAPRPRSRGAAAATHGRRSARREPPARPRPTIPVCPPRAALTALTAPTVWVSRCVVLIPSRGPARRRLLRPVRPRRQTCRRTPPPTPARASARAPARALLLLEAMGCMRQR